MFRSLLEMIVYVYLLYFRFVVTNRNWTFLTAREMLEIYYIYSNPPCQLSLWEETEEPGENPRLSVECWQTLPTCDQMFDTGLEPMTSVVGGRRLDDWATKAQ